MGNLDAKGWAILKLRCVALLLLSWTEPTPRRRACLLLESLVTRQVDAVKMRCVLLLLAVTGPLHW